jgi:hypothetical protein
MCYCSQNVNMVGHSLLQESIISDGKCNRPSVIISIIGGWLNHRPPKNETGVLLSDHALFIHSPAIYHVIMFLRI